jgi:hypothetical protein
MSFDPFDTLISDIKSALSLNFLLFNAFIVSPRYPHSKFKPSIVLWNLLIFCDNKNELAEQIKSRNKYMPDFFSEVREYVF